MLQATKDKLKNSITILRIVLSLVCLAIIGYFLIVISIAENTRDSYLHKSLAGGILPILFVVFQPFLSLLPPWGKWLGLVSALNIATWAVIWLHYNEGLDERGINAGVFLICNVLFLGALLLRALFRIIVLPKVINLIRRKYL